MADMPDYVSHGAMPRVDQVSVVKLTHKYDFVTCFVTTLQTVCYPCKQSVQMTSLLTFRRPYGEVFGHILGKVVGGGQDADMQAATPGPLLNCLRSVSLHVCLRPRCTIAFWTA